MPQHSERESGTTSGFVQHLSVSAHPTLKNELVNYYFIFDSDEAMVFNV